MLGLADAPLVAEHCDGLMLIVSLMPSIAPSLKNPSPASVAAVRHCWASSPIPLRRGSKSPLMATGNTAMANTATGMAVTQAMATPHTTPQGLTPITPMMRTKTRPVKTMIRLKSRQLASGVVCSAPATATGQTATQPPTSVTNGGPSVNG